MRYDGVSNRTFTGCIPFTKERMLTMAAKVDTKKCTGCKKCVDACPMDVIEIRNGKAVIGNGCVECGACVAACPNEAISF